MQINPYLHFDGDCREAFEFYAQVLGGKITMSSTFGESPPEARVPGMDDKIMHISLEAEGAMLYGSDTPPQWVKPAGGFTVSLQLSDPARADTIYAGLAAGGQQTMPMQETFWATRFGMLIDKFGMPWMVNCQKDGVG